MKKELPLTSVAAGVKGSLSWGCKRSLDCCCCLAFSAAVRLAVLFFNITFCASATNFSGSP